MNSECTTFFLTGEITVEEFKNGLDHLNAGLSTDEIVDLIREVDRTPDGRISKHEFERLFLQHCSASNTSLNSDL